MSSILTCSIMVLNEQQALSVWKILVEECGAADDDWDRDMFVQSASEEQRRRLEYRFCGDLGFGGKIYLDDPPRVSCYPEDSTPDRQQMIEMANKRLKDMFNL